MIDDNKVLIAFEENSYAICYGHSKKSCRFNGHVVDITRETGPLANIIKRFGRDNLRIFIGGKCFDVIKNSKLM